MATDKQIEANRLNAQKCTGPRTAEGKAASSQNALKTGLNAKSDVIITENRDEFNALSAEYYARYKPTEPEERCLVDDLVRAEWLGRRYMAASTAIWEFDFGETQRQDPGYTFIRRSEAFGRAQRCITATQRNFAHALKQLQAIREKRQADATQPADTANEPVSPILVSFFHDVAAPFPPTGPPSEKTVPLPPREDVPPIAA